MNNYGNMTNQSLQQNMQAYIGPQVCPPQESSILAQATELLNYVATLESHMASLRGVLFGEGQQGIEQRSPSSISGLLSQACSRVASLCGDAATIKGKLGCDPLPPSRG